METQDYRRLLVFSTTVLILIVVFAIFNPFFPYPKENFSEIWILGPDYKAEDYPLKVQPNKTYSLFLGISNHMNENSFYKVKVKIRNQTQPPPDIKNTIPSPLPTLYEFESSIPNKETWETLVNFEISNITLKNNDTIIINEIKFNNSLIPVKSIARWDSANNGFYYNLFFELWRYNTETQEFLFDNRFVAIWLNLTNSIFEEEQP